MGSYLLMIALVDRYYRGVYFIHDSEWRSSRLCAMAGFLSTFSSELSVFTLTGQCSAGNKTTVIFKFELL
jgi:leucine-rich repeat-containing G protein-coupled receptor 8